MKKLKIPAECHSDDYIVQVEFDAEAWFKQATEEEVFNLIECGWRGDYPADEVALFTQRDNAKLQNLFEYIQAVHRVTAMGFEVSVDEEKALEWMQKNRPELVKE